MKRARNMVRMDYSSGHGDNWQPGLQLTQSVRKARPVAGPRGPGFRQLFSILRARVPKYRALISAFLRRKTGPGPPHGLFQDSLPSRAAATAQAAAESGHVPDSGDAPSFGNDSL